MIRAAWFLAFAVALAGCHREAPTPSGLTRVSLQTDWYAQPEHGGFYQALVKGFYRDAGLDVEIRQGSPGVVPRQLVATGQADFAIGRSDEVIVAESRGVPLVMIGALMELDPQALMYHEGSGIRSFRDLDGRNLMAVPGSPWLDQLRREYHISFSVTPTDFGIDRFINDPRLVTQCFVTNEPYYARKHGQEVGVLMLSGTGFSPYRVWYTRRDLVRDHPDLVRAFNKASVHGWVDYVNGDRSAADSRLEALNPRMNPEFIAYSVAAMQSHHLISGDAGGGDAPGKIRADRIATQIDQLAKMGALDRKVTVDDVYWAP